MRPKGSVERECELCHWSSWHDPISSEATAVPFICQACALNPEISTSCEACNRQFKARHRDLTRMYPDYRCADCADIPAGEYAKTVYRWEPTKEGKCGRLATEVRRWRGILDKVYHLCDEHAADWMYDQDSAFQKRRLRERGAKIIELGGGAWTFEFPHRGSAV